MNVLAALKNGYSVFNDKANGFVYIWNEASKLSVYQVIGSDVVFVDDLKTDALCGIDARKHAEAYNRKLLNEIENVLQKSTEAC